MLIRTVRLNRGVLNTFTYPNVRRIDLRALRGNLTAVRRLLPAGTRVLAVLKADAYGHGMLPSAHAVCEAGADMIGVAAADEGIALREGGVTLPVLVLGPAMRQSAGEAVKHGLTMTVCSPDMVAWLEEAAAKAGKTVDVHLKIDTGMNRIGCRNEEEVAAMLQALDNAPHVRLTGAFTHFADADGDDDSFTKAQLARFTELAAMLPEGVIRHCANSAAALRLPEAALDMVRVGLALYGYAPVETDVQLERCMTWETDVTFVKDIQPGESVSYGCTFTADRTMRAATIACGYGDGYHRAASGQAEVLIGGRRCRILGRICMDQMIADVTDVPDCRPGDRAVLMGRMGSECITAEDIARWAGTIPYEILLAATGRVRRIFEGGGQTDEYSPENERK